MKIKIIGDNWMNSNITFNSDCYELLGNMNLVNMVKVIDESLAFLVPAQSKDDFYAYSLLAFERKLPYITTPVGATGLFESISSVIENPFASEVGSKQNPLLVASTPFEFQLIFQKLQKDSNMWSKYSDLIGNYGIRHFSKYKAAIRLDNLMQRLLN
jgi:hypothetical protein